MNPYELNEPEPPPQPPPPPPGLRPPVPTAAQEPPNPTVANDSPCGQCGYNLRGLPESGTCPESGASIAWSIRGNLLQYAPAGWLRKLQLGTLLLLVHVVASLMIGCGLSGVSRNIAARSAGTSGLLAIEAMTTLFGIAVELVWLAGVVLVTSPDPRTDESDQPLTLRKAVVICAVAAFVGQLLEHTGALLMHAALPLWLALVPRILGQVLGLAGVVVMFGLFIYYRRLALRIPHAGLARQTRTVMWGMILSTGIALLGGLVGLVISGIYLSTSGGPTPSGLASMMGGAAILACPVVLAVLVFGIWALVLLVQYHQAFGLALGQARMQREYTAPADT